jgi:polyhydroxyalkanoate synthesis regulator phasin
MPQSPDWKQVMQLGMQFTELRRSQARKIASDLVAQGQLARDQLSTTVDEIVEMSRRRTDELRSVVQSEVGRQLGALGLATKEDLARLERKLTGGGSKRAAKKGAKQAKKSAKAAKKTATKRAPSASKRSAKASAKPSAGSG